MSKTGVRSTGIVAPFIREGDDIAKIVAETVLNATVKEYGQMNFGGAGKELGGHLNYGGKDVVGITESVVARSYGLYVSVDDIANDIRKKFGDNATICLTDMIYSRNRFSMILKGIARAAKKLILVMESEDEVGNPRGVNRFTGVNIEEYYTELCKGENCEVEILHQLRTIWNNNPNLIYPGVDYVKDHINGFIDCSLHGIKGLSHLSIHSWYCFHPVYTLYDICTDKNPDFGLLGCNKATEEKIKLFPTREMAAEVCAKVRELIRQKTGKDVIVMVYGDGAYKDLDEKIWELADPVSFLSDDYGYEKLNLTPNEVKLKSLIDNSSNDEEVNAVLDENKGKDLVGNMTAMGTTPRRFGNLLASLMDLTSGSGSRCTPIVLVQNYF